MSDCRVPMPSYDRRKASPLREARVREFSDLVAGFAKYGDWTVHEVGVSGKCFAKAFGTEGFVTIEDFTWKGQGYAVSIRYSKGPMDGKWEHWRALYVNDGTLECAIAEACEIAGVKGGEVV